MIPARGAIDNHGALHTKAVSLVTLAPVWEHLAVKEVKFWIYVCRTCLPQTLHCLGVKDKSPSKGLSPFYGGGGGDQHSQRVIGHSLMSHIARRLVDLLAHFY